MVVELRVVGIWYPGSTAFGHLSGCCVEQGRKVVLFPSICFSVIELTPLLWSNTSLITLAVEIQMRRCLFTLGR